MKAGHCCTQFAPSRIARLSVDLTVSCKCGVVSGAVGYA